MNGWDAFQGYNAAYMYDLYDRYRTDPQSVDPETRDFFEQRKPPPDGGSDTALASCDLVMGVVNLASSLRTYGHLGARIDPIGTPPPNDPSLDPATHGLTEDDLRRLPPSLIGGPIVSRCANAWEALEKLRTVYSSTMAYNYTHLPAAEEREWMRWAAETQCFRPPSAPLDVLELLERLTQVEVFEHFIHRIFPGKFRFSLEGLDMMVPVLDEIISNAAEGEIRNILIGMAHRGRLNVLAHVLGKPYDQILAEFKDPVMRRAVSSHDYAGWSGDVKYHRGTSLVFHGEEAINLVISMAPNPSHLEHVNPVVQGMARAAGTRVDRPGPPRFDYSITLPVVIHGDAAFPGQGVVAETLNLSRLQGYSTGGTIHIIANNQLGFTTNVDDSRSTLYASDIARGFEIPIIHVNADDPVACIEAARMAYAFRSRFHKDFLIDLVGYRRWGHNEADDPAFTQPVMYQLIEKHPTVRAIWGNLLVRQKQVDPELPKRLLNKCTERLQKIFESLEPEESYKSTAIPSPPPGVARRVRTAVSAERLRALHAELVKMPPNFNMHSRLERLLKKRAELLTNPDEKTIDWSLAEQLAYGSILEDGISIRLTGEDSIRGTFSHRHAGFHDAQTGELYIPLQNLPQAKVSFEIFNSPLSENAVVGFEYGYNVQKPGRLVIWEAQYGDFINGAQVMIDEFVMTARAKWGQTPSLVFLLPHGYEGQGPDHSSARLERFLEQAADFNVRIANCTSAAQYFHLLRRQAALLRTDPLPLIVLTPKSLLRNPLMASSLNELSEGRWQPVIDDTAVEPAEVRRLVFCSGKVAIDLIGSEHREQARHVAIARVEQVYPYPAPEIEETIARYPNLTEVVWVQEEPINMGAWDYLKLKLDATLAGRYPLHYLGRPRNSSPAEGSAGWHQINQRTLVNQALGVPDTEIVDEDIIWIKAK